MNRKWRSFAEQDPGDIADLNISALPTSTSAFWLERVGWQSFVAGNEVACRAVSLNARDEVSQTALGSTELFLGQIDSGIERLHSAVALRLFPVGAQRGRVRSRRALARRERPGFPGPYRIRAACLSDMDRIEEARKSIDQFLRLASNATLKNLRMQVSEARSESRMAQDFDRRLSRRAAVSSTIHPDAVHRRFPSDCDQDTSLCTLGI
ncbi:MAG: hypothetical protein ABIS68_08040 [Casimicrobiaceae bacterium]